MSVFGCVERTVLAEVRAECEVLRAEREEAAEEARVARRLAVMSDPVRRKAWEEGLAQANAFAEWAKEVLR